MESRMESGGDDNRIIMMMVVRQDDLAVSECHDDHAVSGTEIINQQSIYINLRYNQSINQSMDNNQSVTCYLIGVQGCITECLLWTLPDCWIDAVCVSFPVSNSTEPRNRIHPVQTNHIPERSGSSAFYSYQSASSTAERKKLCSGPTRWKALETSAANQRCNDHADMRILSSQANRNTEKEAY